MKREEIEQLLAEYVNGEISLQNRQQLEKLFGDDPALKKEADEMLATWHLLTGLDDSTQPDAGMDDQFYAMLQRAKTDRRMEAKVVTINKSWLQAAAVIICITAFGIGRFTASPEPVFKYKTVYVKQPVQPAAPAQQPVAIAAAGPAKTKAAPVQAAPVNALPVVSEESLELSQQLGSVYASERIGAIMKIAGKGKLTDADLQRLGKALIEDSNSNVRLTVLDALRPLATRQNVQGVLIAAMSKQDDPLIQNSIVDMLVDAKSKQAIPQMIALLDDKTTNPTMQNKIKAGIESFLNDDKTTNPTGQNRNKAGVESFLN